MNTYDEDLEVNPFYKALLEYHTDLENAAKKDWIICIPRNGTINPPFSKADIYSHILIPNGSTNQYKTLNNQIINLTQNMLEINDSNDYFSSIQILFTETFYWKHLRYKVYCLEVPLMKYFIQANPISHISNVRDCIDFIWIETYGREVLQRIGKLCHLYLKKHHNSIHFACLIGLKGSIERLYKKCIAIPLECSRFQEKMHSNVTLLPNIKLAIETFMQHTLRNYIFLSICAITSYQDSNFNKITRNLQGLPMKYYGISTYQEQVSSAKCELNKINHYITALGKINCLKATFTILSSLSTRKDDALEEKTILNADDLVQLFSFIIIKLNVNNWIANLTYLKEFMFCLDGKDESSYLITSLEAAIEYVRDASLISKLNSDLDAKENKVVVDIRNCNLESLKCAFKPHKVEGSCNGHSLQDTLCHPLCSCDKCEQFLTQNQSNHQTCFTYLDEKGRNCLHIACMYGYPQIVDFLLNVKISCNIADYSGSYPLHYTASRGHLNSLLLLLHSGADINVTNADGNSALHLAANNGHENCIKGLLYYSEHQNNIINVNHCNTSGETALHLASKWGYMNIINILLEYRLDFHLKNKRNETAFDVAHSINAKKLISTYVKSTNAESVEINKTSGANRVHADFVFDWPDSKTYGVRPRNFEQFKKADLLLKSIENNDLPLSCFYLGVPISPIPSDNNYEQQPHSDTMIASQRSTFHCHPLCDCTVCSSTISFVSMPSSSQQIKLNVNICNSEGITPLHVAAQFGRNEILRLLLDSGADCNLQTYKAFYTPLHLACLNQRVLALKELLLSGSCNVDIQDGKGNTALHYACSKNNLRMLDMLLSKGADSCLQNNEGDTVLRLAQKRSLFAAVKIIKEKSREIHSSYEELL